LPEKVAKKIIFHGETAAEQPIDDAGNQKITVLFKILLSPELRIQS